MLRAALYNRLKTYSAFLNKVTIANENEPMSAYYVMSEGKWKLEVEEGGEYYRVNCPICDDTRRRLWINHRWGLRDTKTGSLNLFLMVCYNEGCYSSYDRCKSLYDEVFSDFDKEDVAELREQPVVAGAPTAVDWPGRMELIKNLPLNHPARMYLESEGFNAQWLSDVMDVRYCLEPFENFRMATNRIIIPIYKERELVGWQARYVGKPPKGIPKYYSAPGMKRNYMLYNWDNAAKYDHVALLEGPKDVWAVGEDSVAMFGKSLSVAQAQMLLHFKKIYICLDGDAEVDAMGLYDTLAGKVETHLVHLPLKLSPGNLPRPKIREIIFHGEASAAAKVGR